VREAGIIMSQAVLIAIGVDWEGRRQVLSGAFWQRCYVHFLRNALDYVPRRVDDDCLLELRWMYDRRDLSEVRRDLAAWLAKWSGKYPKLTGWVEKNIEETVTYCRQPLAHRKPMKPTNMLERLNEEIRRRTYGVRIFPNARSCLRLVRALCVETYEAWLEAHIYLNMQLLTEHKKETLRQAARRCSGSPRGRTHPSPPPSLARSCERAAAAPRGCSAGTHDQIC
jgi:putative transposase